MSTAIESRKLFRLGAALLGLSVMAACSGIQETVGLGKVSPDEFQVVSQAPLTLPPNFQLRPPEPGAPRPQEGTTRDQARTAIFRAGEAPESLVVDDGTRSSAEQSFAVAAGAETANPDIRQLVERETKQLNEDSVDFVQSLAFWQDDPVYGDIVDAQAEAKRLRETSALGKPISGDGVPTIVRKKKGLLEGIF